MDDDAKTLSHRWPRWIFGFCVWSLLGLSFALSSYLGARQDNVQISAKRLFTGYLFDFLLWGTLSPLIFKLSKRFELRKVFPRNLFIHLGVSVLLSFVVLSGAALLTWYIGYPNLTRSPTLFALWRSNAFSIYYFHQGLTIYWATVAVAHALHYYRGIREGEARTAHLAAQLAQAQLQALKMQIQPHFLFNTLNSIAALLHKDVETADKMIARLGDFLRMTLNASNAQAVHLEQELEFLKCYLEIQYLRFQDRLSVNFEIDPQSLPVMVPNLILQPIVENAVGHGVAGQTSAGHIIIRSLKQNGRLKVEVEDNGPGLKLNPNGTSGIGLKNTRARLEQLYGNNYHFEIANSVPSGVIVTLEIPAQTNNDGC